jgi:hypothetical protein
MMPAMTTTIAKPRPMKLNRTKAELVPVAQFQAWYDRAILTPGLSGLELALLSAIAEYHRQLQEKGDAGSLSLLRLADADPEILRHALCRDARGNAISPLGAVLDMISEGTAT